MRQPVAPTEPIVTSIRLGRTTRHFLWSYGTTFVVLLVMHALLHGSGIMFWLCVLAGPMGAVLFTFSDENPLDISSMWWFAPLITGFVYLMQFAD